MRACVRACVRVRVAVTTKTRSHLVGVDEPHPVQLDHLEVGQLSLRVLAPQDAHNLSSTCMRSGLVVRKDYYPIVAPNV